MRNKSGFDAIECGMLLLVAAFAWSLHNLLIEEAAGIISQEVVETLEEDLPAGGGVLRTGCDDSLQSGAEIPVSFIPDYLLNPAMEMPEKGAGDGKYIALLSIPSLGLELPVSSGWNYMDLRTSPCRYSGSAYTGNLVICAHNYDIHFGSIKYLTVGDPVILTDMDGNQFFYEVIETENLDPYAIEQMKTGDWDLTLFTCTIGGRSRVTVRCELM